ncbi:TRAP transporter TAXI family solute receptor [Crossiella equi]|uniref:TRAP transporter TAXI family solute receptor n=1 Tax=Crossiella equi TaxID=130796 RepID=A0ABS5AGJ1_9PSEU|nr:TAXI family TRAP transporter solute-binding subunit [Crossiella equi]MBP2475698.1 TRAP transporter TAXI family solute receptor [Crossiella equi]
MKLSRAIVAVTALALTVAGCGGKRVDTPPADQAATGACEASEGRITIATGNAGGVYYVLGGGLAQVISGNSKLKATAAETGASVQNIQQLVAGDYDVAFSLADTAADAVAGKDSFTGKPQKVKALSRVHPNYVHVVVRADSGITSVKDMRGKRISTGSPKSGTEVIANRLLTAAGLNPATDVQAQRLDLTKTVDGMKDGTIDGLVWVGGLPTAQITDLTTSLKDRARFVDVTPLLNDLKRVNPVYDKAVIPAATYKSPADVPTVVIPNVLLVREDFANGNACQITKLLYDKKDELARVHPAAKDIDVQKATIVDPIPVHPGALQALEGLR